MYIAFIYVYCIKWLNIGSHDWSQLRDSSILVPKITVKFRLDHTLRVRQMQVGTWG